MNRRDALLLLAASTSLTALGKAFAAAASEGPKSSLALVIYTLALRRKAMQGERPKQDLFEPLTYLDYCHSLGASGVQVPLGARDADYAVSCVSGPNSTACTSKALSVCPRTTTTWNGSRPKSARPARWARWPSARRFFPAAVTSSSRPSRNTLPPRSGAGSRGQPVPVLERHRVRLAIENHKDHRVEELLALLRAVGSEYVGACVYLANNFTLLEDPLTVVEGWPRGPARCTSRTRRCGSTKRAFSLPTCPWAKGFWISRRWWASSAAQARRAIRPGNAHPRSAQGARADGQVLGHFPHCAGQRHGRTLRLVRTHQARQLPQISRLPLAEQVACESAGIAKSFQYAREVLGL